MTITYNPSSPGTDTMPTITEEISICSSPVLVAKDSAEFNGKHVSGLTNNGSCVTGTVTDTAVLGTNSYEAWGCSETVGMLQGECINAGLNIPHTAGNVKATGTPPLVSGDQDTTETFYVSNYLSSTMTDTLTATCSGSGVSDCTVSHSPISVLSETPQTVTVTYKTAGTASSGTVQLKIKSGSFVDSASVPITVGFMNLLTVSTAYTNSEDQDQSRCYMACFTMTASKSTVPYVSRDVARSVTLVYNGDRVASRPIINADVMVASGSGDTTYSLSYLSLAAFIHQSGAWQKVVFVNGDTTIYYSKTGVQGASVPYRLMGQFDASGFANANYPLKIVVTATYPDGHQEMVTDSSHHIVVYNTRGSEFGRGWTVLGQNVQLNEEGGGPTGAFGRGNGSTIHYDSSGSCYAWGCAWAAPAGASVATQLRYVNVDTSFHGGVEITYPDSSKEYYGSLVANQIVRTVSRQHDTVFYDYDSQFRLIAISDPYRTDPGGSPYDNHTYWHIGYGTNGVDSIVEPDSNGNPNNPSHTRVTLLTVNQTTGYLTKWQDPDGDSTVFGYDTEGRLNSITDRNGNLTRYTYDPNSWKVDSVISPAIPIDSNSTGSHDTASLRSFYFPPQTCVLPTGRTSVSSPALPYETGTYCGYAINNAGHATHLQLDQWGQILAYDYPNGYTYGYSRDGNGFPTAYGNAGGQQNSYTYAGPFLTSSTPAGQNTTYYAYGAFAQLDSSYGLGQPTQKFFVNDSAYKQGHIDSVEVAGGVIDSGSTTRYYAATSGVNIGRDIMMTDTHNNSTTYGYDASTGNKNNVTDVASARSVSTTFDRLGRAAAVNITGTNGTTVTTAQYDILNRVTTTTDAYNRATAYGYDSLGNQTSIKDPAGNVYTTVYNAVGWATSQTDPAGRTTSTTYNGFGLPAVVTNRRDQTITYQYDNLGRQLSVSRPAAFSGDSGIQDNTYYSFLGDTVIASNKVSKDVTYNSLTLGWVDSTNTWINGNKIRRFYHHDALGRVDSVSITTSVSGGFDPYTRHYYYDATYGYLDSLKLRTQKIAYSYTNYQLTGTTYPISAGTVSRSDTYTGFGPIATTTWSGFGGTGVGGSLSRGYSYDSTGRIVQMNVNGMNEGDTSFTYNYDLLGELTDRQLDTVAATQTCTTQQYKTGYCYVPPAGLTVLQNDSIVFDATGNLDTLATGSTDTVGTVLPGNRLSTWTGLTFYGDSDGNRDSVKSSAATVYYTWSADGLLRQVKQGTATRQYYYNAMGQLLFRSDNGTIDQFYLWDNGQILAILDGTATNRVAEFAYAGTDQPIARITGNVTNQTDLVNFLAQDAIGNVFAQFNGVTAEVGQQLAYDPWGAATVSSVTKDTTQLRWKGLLYEGGPTSLYYMRARWYDPVTRRFVSPDPQGLSAGINQYAFGGGDPINSSDPSGMDVCDPDSSPSGCAGGDIPPFPDPAFSCIAGSNGGAACLAAAQQFVTAYASGDAAAVTGESLDFSVGDADGASASLNDAGANAAGFPFDSPIAFAGIPASEDVGRCNQGVYSFSQPGTVQGFSGPVTWNFTRVSFQTYLPSIPVPFTNRNLGDAIYYVYFNIVAQGGTLQSPPYRGVMTVDCATGIAMGIGVFRTPLGT